MTAHIGNLSCGILLVLTVLTGLLPTPTKGNVMGQRALQREPLGESPPEVISINDNSDYRELEEPLINDYSIKSKVCDELKFFKIGFVINFTSFLRFLCLPITKKIRKIYSLKITIHKNVLIIG